MANVTINDVALEAKVSKSSVSRILSGSTGSRHDAATELRVREAAERLGYQVHIAARYLRRHEKTMVGLAVKLSQRPHINRLLIAVRDEVARCNLEPVLLEPRQLVNPTEGTPFPSLEMLAGVLSLDLEMEREVPEFYSRLSEKMPVVALYKLLLPGTESVSTSLTSAMSVAVRHLTELGHKRIAFAAEDTNPHYPSSYGKVEGWQQALQDYNLDASPELFMPVSSMPFFQFGVMADQAIAALEKLDPLPTALVCSNDELAMAVLGKLAVKGWKLPQDLSVIGFDGIYLGEHCYPPLTTVEQQVDEIARIAVERLQCQLQARREGKAYEPQQYLTEPVLTVRSSTARL
jgi:LacI family transcriptional regulator